MDDLEVPLFSETSRQRFFWMMADAKPIGGASARQLMPKIHGSKRTTRPKQQGRSLPRRVSQLSWKLLRRPKLRIRFRKSPSFPMFPKIHIARRLPGGFFRKRKLIFQPHCFRCYVSFGMGIEFHLPRNWTPRLILATHQRPKFTRISR